MSIERADFSRSGLVLLALLALGWGFNWPIMKIVLVDVAPLTFRGVCLLSGGIGVLLLARIGGQSLAVPAGSWTQLLLLTATNILVWNVCVIYGVAMLPSGRAALLGYTMPIWSTLLSVWFLHERLTPRRVLALILAMAGIFVLMSADLANLGGALGGVALLLTAAMSWAVGLVMLKRFIVPMPTFALTGWLMLLGGIPVALGAIALEHDQWRAVGTYPALGVLYNIFVSFMFCYWAWNRIVLMVPVAVSSLSSLITPVIGVLSGAWLLNEPLTWREIVAAGLILGGIAIVVRSRETRSVSGAGNAPVA